MGVYAGPEIVEDGLVLAIDAGNTKSYPGSGTTWIDLSGNGNNGTLVNGVGFDGGNGGSLSFDGVNDYVNLGTSLTNGYINISVSIWCYITSNNGNNTLELVTKYPGGNGWIVRYLVDINKFSVQGREDGTLFINIPSSSTYSINNWYNVVFTKNASNWRLYINSSLDADTNIDSGTVPFNNNGILSIASIPTFNFYSKSNIAQVSIYNRALTASEVQQNFNATRSRYGI